MSQGSGRRPTKLKMERKTYALDKETIRDLAQIQSALRATSASEAVRHVIRRYADQVRRVQDGWCIMAKRAGVDGRADVVSIDVPGA